RHRRPFQRALRERAPHVGALGIERMEMFAHPGNTHFCSRNIERSHFSRGDICCSSNSYQHRFLPNVRLPALLVPSRFILFASACMPATQGALCDANSSGARLQDKLNNGLASTFVTPTPFGPTGPAAHTGSGLCPSDTGPAAPPASSERRSDWQGWC